MSLVSRLQPDTSVSIGVLTAIGVYMIYNQALPNQTDVRSAMPHNDDVESARKSAAIKSLVLIGGVFIISRDLNTFIIGGSGLVGIDYMYKHANGTHPATGKLDASGSGQTVAPGLSQAYPMPDYSEAG